MTDALSPTERSENMRRIRAVDTKPEMAVRRLVHGMGFKYRLHVSGLPGKPDLVFPRLSKIIEVRGCFWHQHPWCIDAHIPQTRREYWEPKLNRNIERDRLNLRQLRKLGYRVLIVWECEVKKPGRLASKLKRFLAGTPAESRTEKQGAIEANLR